MRSFRPSKAPPLPTWLGHRVNSPNVPLARIEDERTGSAAYASLNSVTRAIDSRQLLIHETWVFVSGKSRPRIPRSAIGVANFSTGGSGRSSGRKKDPALLLGAGWESGGENVAVAVWWDFENCNVPIGIEVYKVGVNIVSGLRMSGFKGPVSISAYGDTLQLSRSTQEALTSTGIRLHHIPSGGKDSSDRALLVDLILWTFEHPPPAHLFLISGDRDFSNALHRLRMMNYNILLACPAGATVSPALLGAATQVWQWNSLVRGEGLLQASIPPDFRPPDGGSPGGGNSRQNVPKPNPPPVSPSSVWPKVVEEYSISSYEEIKPNAAPVSPPQGLAVSECKETYAEEEKVPNHGSVPILRQAPKDILQQFENILTSHPKGILLYDLESHITTKKLPFDRDFYGYGKLIPFLSSIPMTVKLERVLSKDTRSWTYLLTSPKIAVQNKGPPTKQAIQSTTMKEELQKTLPNQESSETETKREIQKTSMKEEVQNTIAKQEPQENPMKQKPQKAAMQQESMKTAVKQETHKTAMKQETQNIAVEQEMQKVAVEQETQKAAVKQETQKTAVGQETQKAALKQETQKVAVEEEAQRTAVNQETQKTAVQQESKKAAMKQEKQETAVKGETRKTPVKQTMEKSWVNQEIREPAVKQEKHEFPTNQEPMKTPKMHSKMLEVASDGAERLVITSQAPPKLDDKAGIQMEEEIHTLKQIQKSPKCEESLGKSKVPLESISSSQSSTEVIQTIDHSSPALPVVGNLNQKPKEKSPLPESHSFLAPFTRIFRQWLGIKAVDSTSTKQSGISADKLIAEHDGNDHCHVKEYPEESKKSDLGISDDSTKTEVCDLQTQESTIVSISQESLLERRKQIQTIHHSSPALPVVENLNQKPKEKSPLPESHSFLAPFTRIFRQWPGIKAVDSTSTKQSGISADKLIAEHDGNDHCHVKEYPEESKKNDLGISDDSIKTEVCDLQTQESTIVSISQESLLERRKQILHPGDRESEEKMETMRNAVDSTSTKQSGISTGKLIAEHDDNDHCRVKEDVEESKKSDLGISDDSTKTEVCDLQTRESNRMSISQEILENRRQILDPGDGESEEKMEAMVNELRIVDKPGDHGEKNVAGFPISIRQADDGKNSMKQAFKKLLFGTTKTKSSPPATKDSMTECARLPVDSDFSDLEEVTWKELLSGPEKPVNPMTGNELKLISIQQPAIRDNDCKPLMGHSHIKAEEQKSHGEKSPRQEVLEELRDYLCSAEGSAILLKTPNQIAVVVCTIKLMGPPKFHSLQTDEMTDLIEQFLKTKDGMNCNLSRAADVHSGEHCEGEAYRASNCSLPNYPPENSGRGFAEDGQQPDFDTRQITEIVTKDIQTHVEDIIISEDNPGIRRNTSEGGSGHTLMSEVRDDFTEKDSDKLVSYTAGIQTSRQDGQPKTSKNESLSLGTPCAEHVLSFATPVMATLCKETATGYPSLEKFQEWFLQSLKEGYKFSEHTRKNGFDLSLLKPDFEREFGVRLDPRHYGFIKLQDLVASISSIRVFKPRFDQCVIYLLKEDNTPQQNGETRLSTSKISLWPQMYHDCKILLQELMLKNPDGLPGSRLKPLFISRFGYPMDHKRVGYQRMSDLLRLMPDVVSVNGRLLVPSQEFLLHAKKEMMGNRTQRDVGLSSCTNVDASITPETCIQRDQDVGSQRVVTECAVTWGEIDIESNGSSSSWEEIREVPGEDTQRLQSFPALEMSSTKELSINKDAGQFDEGIQCTLRGSSSADNEPSSEEKYEEAFNNFLDEGTNNLSCKVFLPVAMSTQNQHVHVEAHGNLVQIEESQPGEQLNLNPYHSTDDVHYKKESCSDGKEGSSLVLPAKDCYTDQQLDLMPLSVVAEMVPGNESCSSIHGGEEVVMLVAKDTLMKESPTDEKLNPKPPMEAEEDQVKDPGSVDFVEEPALVIMRGPVSLTEENVDLKPASRFSKTGKVKSRSAVSAEDGPLVVIMETWEEGGLVEKQSDLESLITSSKSDQLKGPDSMNFGEESPVSTVKQTLLEEISAEEPLCIKPLMLTGAVHVNKYDRSKKSICVIEDANVENHLTEEKVGQKHLARSAEIAQVRESGSHESGEETPTSVSKEIQGMHEEHVPLLSFVQVVDSNFTDHEEEKPVKDMKETENEHSATQEQLGLKSLLGESGGGREAGSDKGPVLIISVCQNQTTVMPEGSKAMKSEQEMAKHMTGNEREIKLDVSDSGIVGREIITKTKPSSVHKTSLVESVSGCVNESEQGPSHVSDSSGGFSSIELTQSDSEQNPVSSRDSQSKNRVDFVRDKSSTSMPRPSSASVEVVEVQTGGNGVDGMQKVKEEDVSIGSQSSFHSPGEDLAGRDVPIQVRSLEHGTSEIRYDNLRRQESNSNVGSKSNGDDVKKPTEESLQNKHTMEGRLVNKSIQKSLWKRLFEW